MLDDHSSITSHWPSASIDNTIKVVVDTVRGQTKNEIYKSPDLSKECGVHGKSFC